MSAAVEFAVWAPVPERVRLQVDGSVHDMRREEGGWWRAEVEAGPDADYGFLLGDDDTPRPDPRSRRQPEGASCRRPPATCSSTVPSSVRRMPLARTSGPSSAARSARRSNTTSGGQPQDR